MTAFRKRLHMHARTRLLAGLAAGALLAAACGGATPTTTDPSVQPSGQASADVEFVVAPASFDLAVGQDSRFLAGVYTSDRQLLIGGEVPMSFFYLGEDGSSEQELVAETTGTFLPVPGEEPEGDMTTPHLAESTTVTGVYRTEVDFDRPGFWGVGVVIDLGDGPQTATATFQVAPEHAIADAGDDAPRVQNELVGGDADPAAIDSRAGVGDGGEVPDPDLHDLTVADAIAAGRPAVVVIATPVYCVSRFCGPIVETIEAMHDEYADVAEFIHIEVWKDFDNEELNEAAATWIQTEQGGAEPWVFLIGADGKIAARWDNVLDEAELRSLLDTL
jgi:hypothetical protein